MDDLISRQAAIEVLEWFEETDPLGHTPAQIVRALPTAEPKKGRWIDGNEGKWNAVYCPKCSVCGTPFYGIETVRYHYCPNCGARMGESENE